MRMDSAAQWQQPATDAPVLVDLKITTTTLHDASAASIPLSRRPVRRESTTSSITSSVASSSVASSTTAAQLAKLTLETKAVPACALICTGPSDTPGSFAPTSPVFSSLRALLPPPKRFRLRVPSLPRRDAEPQVGVTPPSAPHSFTIPAICRTASSGTTDLSFSVPVLVPRSPQASGARDWTPIVRRPAPTKPASTSSPRTTPRTPPTPAAPAPSALPALDPALAAAEDASKLRTDCTCAHCGRSGSNFPRCPRTSAVWCSRECRVAARTKSRAAARGPPVSAANAP